MIQSLQDQIQRKFNDTIELMENKFDMTQGGNLQDFLAINAKMKDVWMKSSKLLLRHHEAPDFDQQFNYRSVISKLIYQEKGTQPDIAYAANQCACFSADPKKPHAEAVNWIWRYYL